MDALWVTPQLLAVLKAMAIGEVAWTDGGDCYCFYCSWQAKNYTINETNPEPAHEAACPITIARKLLQGMGFVMKLYRLDYEWLGSHNVGNGQREDYWLGHHSYEYAWSKEEALATSKARLEQHLAWPRQRGHRVELIREVVV